jgi:RimJ/RimL family protein N-acetyltransferase
LHRGSEKEERLENEMIQLRKMEQTDLPVFRKWLYTPHIARWYHDPLDWIDEVEKQDGAFCWIHHFIVEHAGKPIGFCQYYACKDSEELWEGYTALGGSYSIDYMIGETDCLGKGFGKMIVAQLTDRIALHPDAKRIVVQPEPENKASCGLLLSCGFVLDTEKEIYVKPLT